ncbi:MAG: OsmC family protein [candidate division WOR-3 bacterium]|nr:OsmC family protein [candidate division WOR-3 bacterium]
MEAKVRWTEAMQFVGISGSSHALVMDTGPDHGGKDTAATPMELLLIALAGCTGMDVVSLLKKMRVNFSGLEINVRAERRDEHPRVFTGIELEYVVLGTGIDRAAVQRAVELSQEKYCSVRAMLRPDCPVSFRITILENTGGSNA